MDDEVQPRTPYPSDVRDEEGAFVAPYLTLLTPDAPHRRYALREVCHARRWLVRTGAPGRDLPPNVPPWEVVSQQTRRWLAAGMVETMVHDLRDPLCWWHGRADQPTAALSDRATRQSTPERGQRAGDAGYKRRNGSKRPLAIDPRGHLLPLPPTPANAQERDQGERLAAARQDVTGETIELAWVAQGDTGDEPAQAAAPGIQREGVTLAEAKRGCVVLPRRWGVARSCAWATRFRRLANDYARCPTPVEGV